ncbi:MAG: filamentous hemagglutinin N-terminal domain-containing protein, partial [Alphaproteobacteria bacterium]|nr:filamentous hemagglutinin N-terminal domain-containing protein [Alphaproteobacteria bacterium]
KPAIHSLVLLSYLVSFVLPVNVAHAHTDSVSGAAIPAPPAPIVKDQQMPQAVPAAPDFGDIAVDKSNPKAPQLDKAPNGVPLVNIRKPDAKGLSHNQFEKLNVGASGVIFNNSTEKDAQSQLGGRILGNSALQGQNARIILTEVTGRDTSTIRGYLEVHGKAAELIIVNPNGIDVNGAGFINIPKATLSTGQLQDLSNGKPIQLKVDGGEITIQGKGLDLKGVSQFDIVTRKVNFDGKLYGAEQNTDVSVRAGKQIYDHESRTSQAHDAPSAEAAPVYAIDSSALGGMYAGKIALISTEKGVGVRAPENMASRMSDITILANGDVVLKNAEAQGKLDVKSKRGSVTVEEGKKLHATGPIQIETSKKITIENQTQVRSETSIQIKAPETLNRGNIESSGTIQFEGNRLFNRGFIYAKDHLETRLQDKFMNRGHVVAQNGALFGVNTYFLNTPDLQKNGGIISVTGPLTVQSVAGGRTQHIVNDSGLIETSGPNGKMLYRAEHMENKRVLTFATRIVKPTGDSKKGTHVVERYLTSNPDVQPAKIYSSADIEFDVSDTPDLGLHNKYSHIYAAKNINVNGDLLQWGDHLERKKENWSTTSYKTKKRHTFHSKKKRHYVTSFGTPKIKKGEAFSAIMQAGGNLNIVTNGVVQTIGTARETRDEFLRENQPPAPLEDNQRNGFNLNSYVQSLSHAPLYETHLGAGHAYLFETRKQYADPRYVLGSDYFFTRIGPFAGQPFAAKRMGDAFVETRFLRKQIFESGLADRLGEVSGEVELMRQLYDNAVEETKDLEIYPGIKMTAELINKLKRDIIWMETEIINGEEVLVPRIYLTSSSAKAHKNAGSQLLAKNINIKAGSANLSGLVASTGETIIETDENLTIKDGRVDGKKTFLKAGSTLRNESSHISGDSLATEAQKTEIITRVDHHQHGRSYNETLGPRAIMESRVAPLEMTTEGDLHTVGALLKGKGGINLVTGGNVLHESAKTHQYVEAHRKKFRFREDHIKHQKTEFDSGGEINSFTIGNEHHQGVAMHAKGPIDLTVGGQFTSAAVHDEDHLSMRMKGGNSWRGKYKKHQEKHSKQADENQYISETGKVNIHATKDVVMEAPYFSSPVGVEVKSEEGKVHLTVSESTSSSHLHQKSASTVWQSMKDKGHQTTTYRMTRANTPDFQASGAKGTQVDVATGRTYSPKDLEAKKFEMALKTPEEIGAIRQADYEKVIASLAQNPETAYVATLASNPDVNLAFYDNHHHHWSVHHSGLTPAAVATIGVAVTAATMGMAAPVVAPAAAGATATTAAATTAVATTTVATTAASTFTLGTALTVGGEAVLASAVTNGIVDTINNKGNFFKAQRNHFRPERLKSYLKTGVTSAATAGLVNHLDLAPKTTGFMTRVQHAAVRQGVQTAADVAFSGESLGEALKHNAPMVMIDAVQGYVAQRIGEWHHGTEEEFIAAQGERLEQSNGDIESIIFTAQETSLLDSVTHKLMHSALG